MKKAMLFILLASFTCAASADTIYTYGGDYVPQWKVQVVYKEKFFENSVYYKRFFAGFIGDKDASYTLPLSAMSHDFILRLGLPDDFSLNADFNYVYQRLGTKDLTFTKYNFNNLQTASIFAEKYLDWWGALAGLRVPFWNNMPFDPSLYDAREEMNLMLGLFIKPGPGMFRYSAGLYNETCMLFGKKYQGNILAAASAGVNIYSSEFQIIDFNCEAAYSARLMSDGTSSVLYVTPQFYVEFYNDFSFIIGVQYYVAASEIFINNPGAPLYLIKINYTANSDKRAVKPKEEIKQAVKEKKWWQIEGVDDEMVPESWKDEAYMEEKQKTAPEKGK
jgi:hypothetical protein